MGPIEIIGRGGSVLEQGNIRLSAKEICIRYGNGSGKIEISEPQPVLQDKPRRKKKSRVNIGSIPWGEVDAGFKSGKTYGIILADLKKRGVVPENYTYRAFYSSLVRHRNENG